MRRKPSKRANHGWRLGYATASQSIRAGCLGVVVGEVRWLFHFFEASSVRLCDRVCDRGSDRGSDRGACPTLSAREPKADSRSH